MVSKAKMRRRLKRAAVKKKYSDIKATKSKRVDDRVGHITGLEKPEGLVINEEEITRKYVRSLGRYKNKNLED
ncbi:hypothetical protein COV19_02925 [Candidatus Woesearchaeota archaeon CG10_big_fil_rev_8_21_14_0_10_44_13]|nr:MAG: hypothetical protein COV19_02925 [Candidatus Woesearchaeota archaeon CG10_big_fil_rev_8_21_14_0_10_44_13]